MKNIIIHGFMVLLFLVTSVHAEEANKSKSEFPGRALYLDVKHITLDDLTREYKDVVFVDTRSEYEFNTLHINGAVNIPLNSPDYKTKIQELRNQNPAKKIITYCNGRTCMKSYKAVRKAKTVGVDNIFAFDSGVFDWTNANPDKASLLGISPVNPKHLIPKSNFASKLLTPDKFMSMAHELNGFVVDVRDSLQRDGVGIFVGKEKRASLQNENEINKLIDQALASSKTMFIYDESGKQVRWLMYRLEQRGVKNYYFMKDGAKGYYGTIRTGYGI